MKLYQTSKTVLGVGPDPAAFLNGLTTNSLDKPRNAFVNIHGRIIATFDQIKKNEKEYALVIEKDFAAPLLAHLDRYARLSKTVIKTENDFVYFDLDGTYVPQSGEYVIPQKSGQLVLTKDGRDAHVTEEEFTLFRVRNNIPLQGVDYKDEMILNVGDTEYVSFTKGCFLGQEPVAKVHHRSKPTWKLVVKNEDECSSEEQSKMTSKISDPVSGRVLGFVFVAND